MFIILVINWSGDALLQVHRATFYSDQRIDALICRFVNSPTPHLISFPVPSSAPAHARTWRSPQPQIVTHVKCQTRRSVHARIVTRANALAEIWVTLRSENMQHGAHPSLQTQMRTCRSLRMQIGVRGHAHAHVRPAARAEP